MGRAHAFSAHSASVHALSTLQDTETGQRGYLLTGDQSFLKTFHDADQLIGERLSVLERADLTTKSRCVEWTACVPS